MSFPLLFFSSVTSGSSALSLAGNLLAVAFCVCEGCNLCVIHNASTSSLVGGLYKNSTDYCHVSNNLKEFLFVQEIIFPLNFLRKGLSINY